MDHPFLTLTVKNNSFISFTQSKNINAIFIERNKIIILFNKNTFCGWFPKLERLVSVHHCLITLMVNVQNHDVEDIDEDGFIAYNYFFVFLDFVSEDVYVGVADV